MYPIPAYKYVLYTEYTVSIKRRLLRIETSTSVALTHTKRTGLIPIYILRDFTEGCVHISFIAWFIKHLIPKNMAKMDSLMSADSVLWFMEW